MTESFITLGALRSYTHERQSLILDYGGPRVAITASMLKRDWHRG